MTALLPLPLRPGAMNPYGGAPGDRIGHVLQVPEDALLLRLFRASAAGQAQLLQPGQQWLCHGITTPHAGLNHQLHIRQMETRLYGLILTGKTIPFDDLMIEAVGWIGGHHLSYLVRGRAVAGRALRPFAGS